MATNQFQGATMKRPVARGTIDGNRQGMAVPVTIHSQAQTKAMPMQKPRPARPPMSAAPAEQPKSGSRKSAGFLVMLALLIVVGFVGYQILSKEMTTLLDVQTVYNGIQFEGTSFGGKTKAELLAFSKTQEIIKNDETFFNVLLEGQDPVPVKFSELSPTYNTAEAAEKAYTYGRDGNRISRYISVLNLGSKPQNFVIEYQVTDAAVQSLIDKLQKELETEMSDASVDFRPTEEVMFVVKGGKNGVTIDMEKLKTDIKNAVDTGNRQDIHVSASIVKPKVSEEQAMANTVLVSEFSTKTTGAYNRDTNIRLASEAFNGVIVQPGEIFSINECTGQRTPAKGYRAAGAINNGKLVNEPGGGVCQVSGTLYGAVLRADMEIVTRHNHRWPSDYVPIGQDAAIDYPSADFKFKNTSDSPIYLRSTKVGTTLTVYVYGAPLKWDKIEVISSRTGTLGAAKAKTVVDKSLKPGQTVVDMKSRSGSTAVAYRIFYKDGKEDHREKLHDSHYAPVQGIIRVGPAAPKTPTAPVE